MKPIPYYFENVRRSALVLRPKKPFQDWLNNIDADNSTIEFNADTDVYMLPDFETIDEMELWLADNFDAIFVDQLNNWYIDEKLWVQNRTLSLFKEWFDYSLHTMVWDTLDEDIDKE